MLDYALIPTVNNEYFGVANTSNFMDIGFNTSGELLLVESLAKTNQDMQKIAITALSELHLYPTYGTGIYFFIGSKADEIFLRSFLVKTLFDAFVFIMQQQRQIWDMLDSDEQIIAIERIDINLIASQYWNIFIQFKTASEKRGKFSFLVSI